MKIKDQLRIKIRALGLSKNTFSTYWGHVESFLRFSKRNGQWVHPSELSTQDVERYLTHLAVDRRVTPNTQNCCLQAIIFFYKHCLKTQLSGIDAIRAKRTRSLPVVYNRQEVSALLSQMTSQAQLVASLMYGSGLRISESISVRIKDFDFERGQLTVRQGKGKKDRITCLPKTLYDPILGQIETVKQTWRRDIENESGVSIPGISIARHRQMKNQLAWYYLFPSKKLTRCSQTKMMVRHHVHKSGIGRKIHAAGVRAGITKRIKPHALRHSFATHMIENGNHIKLIADMLGHASIETTQIYLHCDSRRINETKSPLDQQIGIFNPPETEGERDHLAESRIDALKIPI